MLWDLGHETRKWVRERERKFGMKVLCTSDISAHFTDNILSVSAGHFSIVLTNLECHTNTRLADFAMQTKRGVIYVVLFSMGVLACWMQQQLVLLLGTFSFSLSSPQFQADTSCARANLSFGCVFTYIRASTTNQSKRGGDRTGPPLCSEGNLVFIDWW